MAKRKQQSASVRRRNTSVTSSIVQNRAHLVIHCVLPKIGEIAEWCRLPRPDTSRKAQPQSGETAQRSSRLPATRPRALPDSAERLRGFLESSRGEPGESKRMPISAGSPSSHSEGGTPPFQNSPDYSAGTRAVPRPRSRED